MLLNALVHRTYMGATIQMRVFDKRLSIWNEGGLPFGLSIEDLKADHNSRPRNPLIANACFFGGYIDTWGRGTLKIINACKEAGLPEPDIKEMNGGIEVTIYGQIAVDNPVIVRNDFGMISERIRNDFGSEIEKVFEIIYNHPNYTSQQIAKEVGKTSRTIEAYQAKLKNADIIERKGAKLGGYWVVKNLNL
jgi:ATP-dependent DNA helicase RecG